MTYIIGLIIGTVLGLTGAGGSVFAVPLLMALLDLPIQQAIGISLGAVSACAFYGVLIRIKSKEILWLPALVFASIGSIFSPLGNWLNQFIPSFYLLLGFSCLVLIVASRMWISASRQPDQAKLVRASRISTERHQSALCNTNISKANNGSPFKIGPRCVAGMAAAAAATGILSGLLGVGGGFLIVPTLLFLTGISMTQAVATSMVIIALVSGSGFISYLTLGNNVPIDILVQVALGGLVGMTLGIMFSKKIAGPSLQKGFSLLMLLMAAIIIFQGIDA
jgi:uncharacterized membrane protein YfcA